MRHTPAEGDEVTLANGAKCDRLAYADDVDLMGKGFIARDRQLLNFKTAAARVGLEMNESKTKVMKISRAGREEVFIDLGGSMLEVVDTFKYLGSTITTDNDIKEEISIRIAAASRCSWALGKILQSRILSRKTKLQAHMSIIRPIATYGCESWSLTQHMEHRLVVFENTILRRIYGPVRDNDTGEWRRRHNIELRELSQLPPITSYIRAQRLRWAGHVARMRDGSLVKSIAQGEPHGRRPVGRPRRRWRDNIRQDMELLEVENPSEWWDAAQDRRQWRSRVKAAKDHMGLQLQE